MIHLPFFSMFHFKFLSHFHILLSVFPYILVTGVLTFQIFICTGRVFHSSLSPDVSSSLVLSHVSPGLLIADCAVFCSYSGFLRKREGHQPALLIMHKSKKEDRRTFATYFSYSLLIVN